MIEKVIITDRSLMGVPITFAMKHNIEQFEVIDLLRPMIDKKRIYRRIVIKHRR